jgi:hypothetical protein
VKQRKFYFFIFFIFGLGIYPIGQYNLKVSCLEHHWDTFLQGLQVRAVCLMILLRRCTARESGVLYYISNIIFKQKKYIKYWVVLFGGYRWFCKKTKWKQLNAHLWFTFSFYLSLSSRTPDTGIQSQADCMKTRAAVAELDTQTGDITQTRVCIELLRN